MRALTLWQPWATLVALEAKRIETRGWPAPRGIVGQRIALHAAKQTAALRLCGQEPFRSYGLDADELPLGAIVATVVVSSCEAITADSAAELRRREPDEHAFGVYSAGRYAWRLSDVARLLEPVPYRGAQRVFVVPDDLPGLDRVA